MLFQQFNMMTGILVLWTSSWVGFLWFIMIILLIFL